LPPELKLANFRGEIRSWFDCESTASVNLSLLLREEAMPSVIWETGEDPVVRLN